MSRPIPLTVIGGFLGSGKTTLLNHLIRENAGERLAVLVNDFGDLAIDEHLIVKHGGDTIALANGCICCSIGNDLIATLLRLVQMPQKPDRIVIEASGVADPRPIADMAELHKGFERGGTIVLVDAEQLLVLIRDTKLTDTIERQVVSADLMLLTKCDLASEEKQSAARAWIDTVAPDVGVLACSIGQLPAGLLMTEIDRRALPQDGGFHDDHGQIFRSATLEFPYPIPELWLRERLSSLPKSIWRVKGIVSRDDPSGGGLLVQRVGRRTNIVPTNAYEVGRDLGSLVFIGTIDMPSAEDLAGHFSYDS